MTLLPTFKHSITLVILPDRAGLSHYLSLLVLTIHCNTSAFASLPTIMHTPFAMTLCSSSNCGGFCHFLCQQFAVLLLWVMLLPFVELWHHLLLDFVGQFLLFALHSSPWISFCQIDNAFNICGKAWHAIVPLWTKWHGHHFAAETHLLPPFPQHMQNGTVWCTTLCGSCGGTKLRHMQPVWLWGSCPPCANCNEFHTHQKLSIPDKVMTPSFEENAAALE